MDNFTNAYNYIIDNFKSVNEEEFKKSYIKFINDEHYSNEHHYLIFKDFVFDFHKDDNLYELFVTML